MAHNLAYNYKNFAIDKTVFDEITERDAFIAKYGSEVSEAFYPERNLFNLDEHREFEEYIGLQNQEQPSYLSSL